MKHGSPRKRNTPMRIKIPNFTKVGNWSRRDCTFCGPNSGRMHPEYQLTQTTEKGWVCNWHYNWYFTRRFEDDSPIDPQEVHDER